MPQEPSGWSQAEQYMSAGTAGADAAIDMGRGYEHIRISNLDAAAVLRVDMKNGAATAADFGIPPNQIYYYDGPAIQYLHLFSTGTPAYAIHAY